MEGRDFDYYEARARDVKLDDITSSCEGNATILQQLRDQDTYLKILTISDDADDDNFVVGEGDDLGWLGYFIGKSKYLEDLHIDSWGEGENIEAFIEGINHNRSIDSLHIGTDLGDVNFRSMSPFFRNNNRLAELELNFEVGLECAQSIAHALGESSCQSLKHVTIEDSNLSDGGFAVIATALRSYPQLEELHLEGNNIGLTSCIALADMLRGWGASNLKTLAFSSNEIDDQGLQALAAGMTNTSLKTLYLSNNLITGAGLRSLSDYFQSESCCLRTLDLTRIDFGDEGAMVLADGLRGNQSLKNLYFIPDESGITDVGWAAFSKLVCDPSSINSTYHSNHNIETIGEKGMYGTPPDIREYLYLNERLGWRRAAIHKILKSHPDLDMEPFFQWKLKLLPVVANWFRSARSCLFPDRPRSTQRQSLQNRELSALYKFIRGMPSLTVISYWQQFVMNAQAERRRIDDERRRLEDERRRLYYDEEAAWERLGGRPRREGSSNLVSGTKRRRHV
mmetsp:Transcript_9090/g.13631  ORF Transcript_9090/g.13631 Transcript_9090/m.13631 type:complete len:510 (-) Transcript_9090:161-1690(-)